MKNIGKVDAEHLGLCPCGKEIGANAATGAVVHGIPPCEAFLKLEPTEFLAYVRRSRGIACEN
jgi:hypothetical protein